MMRKLVICFLFAWQHLLSAQEASTHRVASAAAEFTSKGESIAASTAGPDLRVEVTPVGSAPTTLLLTPEKTDVGEGLEIGTLFGISVSASSRVAAIGITANGKSGREGIYGAFVALVDLVTKRWGKHYFVQLERGRAGEAQFLGFLGNSEKLLVIVQSNTGFDGYVDIALLDVSDGGIERTRRDLSAFGSVRHAFFDAVNGRVWLAFQEPTPENQGLHSLILESIAVVGEMKIGPTVTLANLRAQGAPAEWLYPEAMAFPNPKTIVLAETATSKHGFDRSRVWKVDLDSGSIRYLALPKDIGRAMVHGLGLTWFEEVTSPAVMSPDARFVVIPIDLSATAPPYIVDNYESKGSRLVVVDVERWRRLWSLNPEHGRKPIAFAIDHRDAKVTVLVNWQKDWKHMTFAVPQ